MADFSDREDMQLVQLAAKAIKRCGRIDWYQLSTTMATSKKGKSKLQERLNLLKRRFGNDVTKFPPRFFGALPRVRKTRTKSTPMVASAAPPTPLVDAASPCVSNAFQLSLLEQFNVLIEQIEPLEPYTDTGTIYRLVDRLFEGVGPGHIRQPGGQPDYNTGEIAMVGVSSLLECFGLVCDTDVFLDVGCGIGNVVAQVALESRFRLAIGVEMRETVLAMGKQLIDDQKKTERRLQKTRFIDADIRNDGFLNTPPIQETTHLYCHNLVFSEESNMALERLVEMPSLHAVVVSRAFCPRHRPSCKKVFCIMWTLKETLHVPMTYTTTPAALYVYQRRV